MYVFIPYMLRRELRRIQLISGLSESGCSYVAVAKIPLACFLARSREVSGVVYVPGNMAASFRGRPIRSLRMRGKREKLGTGICLIAESRKSRVSQARVDPGVMPQHVRCVCF